MIPWEAVFSKKPKVPWRVIENEAVIVDLDRETIIHLNETGQKIWSLIDGKHTLIEIMEEITELYDINEKIAEQDLADFVGKLLEKGLVNY